MPTPETTISLHNSCRAVWVCKRCGNCARHCKHDDPANFHEDLNLPCSGPCQCIDCVPVDEPVNRELFRIKPLEWEQVEARWSHGFKSVEQLHITYIVMLNQNNQWYVQGTAMIAIFCASPEEGKQLAEQHWQEYIKQALVPVETQQ